MSNGYIISLPLGRGHWITLISNKPMRPEHFAKLDEHLALQKEIFADEPCDSVSQPKAENRSEAEG